MAHLSKVFAAFRWTQSFAFHTHSCVCKTIDFSNVTCSQNLVPRGQLSHMSVQEMAIALLLSTNRNHLLRRFSGLAGDKKYADGFKIHKQPFSKFSD